MAEKEYIERDAAIAVIEEKQKELCPVGMYSRHAVYGSDREKFDAWQEIIDTLEAIPAADVRPVVRGKWTTHPRETWIGVDINSNETQPRQFFAYECPFCGFTTGISGKDYNFCPNCGADMREDKKDER